MRLLLALLLSVPLLAQTPAATATSAAPAPAVAPPVPSTEDWLTGSVDFGYRFTSVGGSNDTYRSVVNQGSGPRLFGLDFTIIDPKKRLFDRLDVRAYNWGGDPYNTVHLNAAKRGIYDFNFDYRDIAYFN